MLKRRFARFLSVLLMCTILCQQQANAQALALETRVAVGVAGAIERTLIRRGFAANDPLFAKTLQYAGVAANDAVFNVAGTAGMVVAGVAGLPAWATVAVGLGIGALAFGAYKLLTQPVSVVDPVTGQAANKYAIAPSSMSVPDIQTALANAPAPINTVQPSGMAGTHYKIMTQSCPAGDMQCAAYQALPLMPSGVRFFVGQADGSGVPLMTVGDWVSNVQNFATHGICGNSSYTGCQVVWDIPPSFSDQAQWFQGHWYVSYTFVDNGQNYTFPMESALGGSNSYWGANPGGFGINPAYQPAPKSATSLDQLLTQLSPEQLAAPLSADSLAQIADATWRNAAAKPGYDGLPYSPTDPVTPTDAQNYLNTNPTTAPTLNDALSPITGPVTIPQPSTNPNPNPDPTTNPPTDSFTPPGMEPIPTAAQILAPILGLLPDFRNYVVPSHSAVCPAPSMELFGKHLVLDAHCTLLDNQTVRQTIYMVMAAVWVAVAIFIILGA